MPKTTSLRLDEEMLARLDRLGSAMERPRSWIVAQAIERYLDYEEWFAGAVADGIAEADRGDLLPHDRVAAKALKRAAGAGKRRR